MIFFSNLILAFKEKSDQPSILVQTKPQFLDAALHILQKLSLRDKSKSLRIITGLYTTTYNQSLNSTSIEGEK